MQGVRIVPRAGPRVGEEVPMSLAGAALGAVAAFFIVNYAFNYVEVFKAAGRIPFVHATCVFVVFGTVIPAALIGALVRTRTHPSEVYGVTLGWRDARAGAVALIVGVVCAAEPIGSAVLAPGGVARASRLFVLLLTASVAEVLVFAGLLFNVCRLSLEGGSRVQTPLATVAAVFVSSTAFGMLHFTYPPPWASWGLSLGLIIVGVAFTAMYVLTRSLVAAILFNNVLAVIGFMRNGADIPVSVGAGILQAAMTAFVAICVLFATTRGRVRL